MRELLRGAGALGALLAAGLLVTGCASSQLSIVVQSSKDTNDQRPFYVLVRSIDQPTYVAEAYQSVARRVMKPDDSVLKAEVIYPGIKTQLDVPRQEKTPVAVYFLLTDPTGEWKTLIEQPLPGTVQILLGPSRIEKP